jgi:hypothetical protein
MTLPPTGICLRIRQLHAMIGSPHDNESANASGILKKLLAEHGLSWNDLPAVLIKAESLAENKCTSTSEPPAVNVLDLLLVLIERHVAITAEERVLVALWILHTYVDDQFDITPRLAVLSPASECGKTRLMLLPKWLVHKPKYSDNVTPAWIYHELDRNPGTTFLLDEVDNQGLLNDRVLRTVFNGGHGREGTTSRMVGREPKEFRTFAPLAVAGIGMLPLPMLSRVPAVINMRRYVPGEIQIQELDDLDPCFPEHTDTAGNNQILGAIVTRHEFRI